MSAGTDACEVRLGPNSVFFTVRARSECYGVVLMLHVLDQIVQRTVTLNIILVIK